MNINDPFEEYTPYNQDFGNLPPQDLWLLQDSDADGLTNQEEIFRGTNPYNADTDGDGLRDLEELAIRTDPRHPDADWNGLWDGADYWRELQPDPIPLPLPVQDVSEYQRLSQSIDSNLPPFLQAKQVAHAALAEDFTASGVHDLLSESPQFKEIASTVGTEQADQFVRIVIAAAERQTAIDSIPYQSQVQVQAKMQSCQVSPRLHGGL